MTPPFSPIHADRRLSAASQQPFTPGNGSLALANKAHQVDSLLHISSVEVLLSGPASLVLIFLDTPGPECDLSF